MKNDQEIIKSIKQEAEDSKGATGVWESNQAKWNKMRMRIKKTKSFPFVGCANIRMPTIETKLRKLKAALVNVIFGIRPVVQAIPNPGGTWEGALKVEKFLDHLIMDIIRLKKKAIIAIDQTLEKGFYLMKPYFNVNIIRRIEEYSIDDLSVEEALWVFDEARTPEEIYQKIVEHFDIDMNHWVAKENNAQIEKAVEEILSGKKDITLNIQDVIANYPDIALCEPERVYVPTDSGFDPQDCEWIIHEFRLPLTTIKGYAKTKKWNIDSIEELEKNKTSSNQKTIDTNKDKREGITQLEKTGKVTVWERYGYLDINNDGIKEKCVVTIAPDFDIILRKITLPFYSGKYPFVKTFYELCDDRWFSHRGIPELIEDVVKEIDIQHMQKLDNGTIRNAPMYVHRAGMINKNAVQFVFGQSLPVSGLNPLSDTIAPINNNNPNVEFSYEREQMLLETKIEELIGQVDFSLQSMINKRQPRTLGEVQLQQQNMQQVFSLDADLFRDSFEELFNWIWELHCQYGDDEYEFAYFGKNGWEQIKLTKEEVQGKYKITVRGNDQNTNPQIRTQKAQMIMAGMNNPVAIQMGVISPVHLANAYKRFYQEMDIPGWEELVETPEKIIKKMQAPTPPPPDDIKINSGDLTDMELANALAKRGIKPDIQGRALKSQAKVHEKQMQMENDEMNQIKTLADVASMIGGEGNNEEAEEATE